MIIETLYRLEIDTIVPFQESDEETCQALVSVMHAAAALSGIQVMTYRINSGKLMMLVSAQSRSFPMSVYALAEEKEPGGGKAILYKKLRKQLNEAGVQQMNRELNELAEDEDDEDIEESDRKRVDLALQRIARRIGNPHKLLQQIEWDFLRWVQKKRPQLYPEPVEEDEDLMDVDEDEVEDRFIVVQLGGDDSLCDLALQMDWHAVEYDQGAKPQTYWCGYSDALREDPRALDGLRKLTEQPDAKSIQELDYPGWLSRNQTDSLPDLVDADNALASSPEDVLNKSTDMSVEAETITPSTAQIPPSSGGGKIWLVAFVLMLGLCSALIFYIQSNKSNNIPLDATTANLSPADLTPTDFAGVNQKRNLEDVIQELYGNEAIKIAEEFAKSSDPKVRLSLSRYPDEIGTRLLSYPTKALNVPAEKVIPGPVIRSPEMSHRRFVARFPDNSVRPFWVVPTTDGLRVDWDSYARHCTATWEELLDGTKTIAEMRLIAIKRPYYNYEYRDEKQWLCFELTSLDYEGSLYGYAKRGTMTARLLDSVISEPGKGSARSVTLRLSSTGEGFKRKQFNIDRVLALGWVRGEQDVEDIIDRSNTEQTENKEPKEPDIPMFPKEVTK